MNWPLPDGDLQWRLRYGKPTKTDLLRAASVLSAYHQLIKNPIKLRDYTVRHIREGLGQI